jgi:hypothetical protein
METPPDLLGLMLSLYFMDKGLWSFGTLFIGSIAHVVGTPRPSQFPEPPALWVLLYQQRQPRASKPAESLKRHITQ